MVACASASGLRRSEGSGREGGPCLFATDYLAAADRAARNGTAFRRSAPPSAVAAISPHFLPRPQRRCGLCGR
jgi:hypothetical protein